MLKLGLPGSNMPLHLKSSGKNVLKSVLDARRLLPFAFILMLAFLALLVTLP